MACTNLAFAIHAAGEEKVAIPWEELDGLRQQQQHKYQMSGNRGPQRRQEEKQEGFVQ